MVTHGRDISAFDSNVNYSQYDFVIGKFTESTNFISPGALDRAAATRAAGKVFSAYHFAQPGDGARQARFFVSIEAPKRGDMPGWLDYEVDGLGRQFFEDFSAAYRSLTNYWPGLYTNLSRFQDEGMASWLKPGQRSWIARYDASSPGVACDIWQYQGDPDLNVAYTPLSEMVIGGSPADTREADHAMASVKLSDGKTWSFIVGTDDGTGDSHKLWRSDRFGDKSSWVKTRPSQGPWASYGADACSPNGTDVLVSTVAADGRVFLHYWKTSDLADTGYYQYGPLKGDKGVQDGAAGQVSLCPVGGGKVMVMFRGTDGAIYRHVMDTIAGNVGPLERPDPGARVA